MLLLFKMPRCCPDPDLVTGHNEPATRRLKINKIPTTLKVLRNRFKRNYTRHCGNFEPQIYHKAKFLRLPPSRCLQKKLKLIRFELVTGHNT